MGSHVMISDKALSCSDEAVVNSGPKRRMADRQAKTRSAANEARRIAAWVAAQAGANHKPQHERPDEHVLFAALQTCAYRATQKVGGKPLTPVERDQWARRWRLVRDYLIGQNLGLAYKMAGRFQTSHIDQDDLRGEAFLALVHAVEGFDPWRGPRFSTYACHAIVYALGKAAKKSSRHQLRFAAEAETRNLPRSNGSRWLELYVERLRSALRENHGDLTEQESTVLVGRFPLGGGSRRTLSQIGDTLGLSKERVRQIQNSALTKLRDALQADPFLQ